MTGGSRGIGAAIAQELARKGVRVCLAACDRARLDAVAASIAATSRSNRTAVIVGDLREPSLRKVCCRCRSECLRAAGYPGEQRRSHQARGLFPWPGGLADGFALKFHGYVRTTRAAWPHLRESHGCIVNIVGVGSRAGSAEFTIGGSVNVALLNFTKAMADIGTKDGVQATDGTGDLARAAA